SKELKSILILIDYEAELLDSKTIELNHIMLGILSSSSKASIILNEMGITYNNYKNLLTNNDKHMRYDDTNDEEPNLRQHGSSIQRNKNSKTPILDNFCTNLN